MNMESMKNSIGIITESCVTAWHKKSVIIWTSCLRHYHHQIEIDEDISDELLLKIIQAVAHA